MSGSVIKDVEALALLFKTGGWTELRVEADGVSLLFSTDPDTPSVDDDAATTLAPAATRLVDPTPVPAQMPLVSAEAQADLVPVAAPNLGTFYRSPKPGAAPFIEVGQRVAADTEMCLLEVMKLFTSVKAGVAGIVRRIDAVDAELVEGGQTLFLIEPA